MFKRILLFCLVLSSLGIRAQVATPAWVKNTGAKSFPSAQRVFYVNDFGAISDTVTVNTKS
ncbi:MAG TPA: glycoside hydrolase family 28 protein, partial [Chitinophagaceae bacterium]|nr:glycoside hydrolase family 28 protein [Chitinophagaceae bacterium]